MSVKESMERVAKEHGVFLSPIADRIIKIKERAIDEYQCPCYPDDKNHWCMSPLCYEECIKNGRCHCGLFVKENKE